MYSKYIQTKTCGKAQVHFINQVEYYCVTNAVTFKGIKYYCATITFKGIK